MPEPRNLSMKSKLGPKKYMEPIAGGRLWGYGKKRALDVELRSWRSGWVLKALGFWSVRFREHATEIWRLSACMALLPCHTLRRAGGWSHQEIPKPTALNPKP